MVEPELQGRVVVISGGADGIGLATARLCGTLGAFVAVLDIQLEAGEQAVQLILESGGQARAYQCDACQRQQFEHAIGDVLADAGQVDALVNVVGGSRAVSIWDMTEAQWDEMLTFNLKSAFLGCKAVLPHMRERRSGAIVNLSSNQGVTPAPLRAHYSAAKAGIIGFTRTLAVEVAAYGIRANAVAPGPTNSARVRANFTDEGWAQRNLDHPLGRVGEPDDVAEAIAFLVGPRARHITGQVLHVNGGLAMP